MCAHCPDDVRTRGQDCPGAAALALSALRLTTLAKTQGGAPQRPSALAGPLFVCCCCVGQAKVNGATKTRHLTGADRRKKRRHQQSVSQSNHQGPRSTPPSYFASPNGHLDGRNRWRRPAGKHRRRSGRICEKKHRKAHTTPPPISHRSVQQPQAPTAPRAHNTRHCERTPHHDSNKTKPALPFSPDPD